MRNARYRGTYTDRDEARLAACRLDPPTVVQEEDDGFAVYELGIRGADGIVRDRRYPSAWGFDQPQEVA